MRVPARRACQSVLLFLLGSSICAADVTTYTYIGNSFTHFTTSPSPYSTANSVTGFFTMASPVAADLALADLTADVLSFSFTDGTINTITSAGGGRFYLLLSTDSGGTITAWDVRAFIGTPPTNSAIFTCKGSTVVNGCRNFPDDESYLNNGAITGYNISNPGTWEVTSAVPEPTTLTLLSVILLSAIPALRRKGLV